MSTPEPLTRRQLRQQREAQEHTDQDDLTELLGTPEPAAQEEVSEEPGLLDDYKKPRRGFKKLTFLGVLQEVFILLALLAGLFVLWFLWGDDYLRGLADNKESDALAQQWEPSNTTLGWLGGEDIPVTATTDVLAEAFATVQIPRFGADYNRTIVNGTEIWPVLNQGYYGHYDGEPVAAQNPGEIGNFAIAAHRSAYGAPLYLIDDFKVGDSVVVRTELGWYVYRVTDKRVTTPKDTATVYPVPDGEFTDVPTQRWMTLTTCHPFHSAAERYIAHAIFDRFIPSGQATPPEATAPADDGTVYVTTTVPESIEDQNIGASVPTGVQPTQIEGGES